MGVFEKIENGALSVCKVTFGAEPKDDEVWAYILRYFGKLQFSPAIKIEERRRADHPKRRQHSITKQLQTTGIGTKSQQALAAQREAGKAERKKVNKAQREAAQQRTESELYDRWLAKEKAKEKAPRALSSWRERLRFQN